MTEQPRSQEAAPLTEEEEHNLRAQDEMLHWEMRRGSWWVKRMTEDWQTPWPEEVTVHRLLATLDRDRAALAATPPEAKLARQRDSQTTETAQNG